MQGINDNIKTALKSRMQQFDDNSFTKKIVDLHLANKQEITCRPFINFLSLIIGLSSLFVNIGLVVTLKQDYSWINGIGITEQHGLLLIAISIIFLIYKFIEEFTAPGTRYSSLAR